MQKISKILTLLLTIFTLAIFLSLTCLANSSGFDLEYSTNEEATEIFKEHYQFHPIEERKMTAGFSCFAANELGQYALGFSSGDKTILVYDNDGTYLYGFDFDLSGSFYLDFDGETLIVYSVRGDVAIYVDSTGTCLAHAKIQDTKSNQEYWRELQRPSRKIGTNIYHAGFLGNYPKISEYGQYSTLKKLSANNKETILYDNTDRIVKPLIFTAVGVLLFVSIAIIVLVYNLITWNRKRKTSIHF